MIDLKPKFPEMLMPLFTPSRYKILYGGRGGSKSWGVARALLIKGADKKPIRVLCARELQKSIKDSVHRLLADQVRDLKLDDIYEVQQGTIKGINGTEFSFEGLRHNAHQIKSYEGVDIVWIEEAVVVSKSSWDYLIPTIRKEGSEIWMTFNPELDEDETYKRFVLNPPKDSIVININWRDNPWFTGVLMAEMEDLKERDYVDYLNVWEGQCRSAVVGAIYAEELRQALEAGRLTSVPYDQSKPVNTFWDLGWADNTSIWFIQKVGFEYHVIDFYQNSRHAIQHYIKVLQDKKYIYGVDYLPHDARAKQLGTGKSIEETLRELGRDIDIVPQLSVSDGLYAVRTVFNALYFDNNKCSEGLQALRRYKFNVNADTGMESREPLHDVNSHAADALRYFATASNVMWDTFIETPARLRGEAGRAKTEYDLFA